jgi:phospholipase C
MIRYRYGVDPLGRRDAYAHNIAHAFDFDAKPRLDNPGIPDAPMVASTACAVSRGSLAKGLARAKEHDLAALYTSGYLERLGFHYKPATAAGVFRSPDSVLKGLEAGMR